MIERKVEIDDHQFEWRIHSEQVCVRQMRALKRTQNAQVSFPSSDQEYLARLLARELLEMREPGG